MGQVKTYADGEAEEKEAEHFFKMMKGEHLKVFIDDMVCRSTVALATCENDEKLCDSLALRCYK